MITFTGPAGGPFSPSTASYRLVARNGEINWSLEAGSPGWLNVEPSSGRIASNESRTLTLTAKDATTRTSMEGEYRGTVTVVDRGSGKKVVQQVMVVIAPPPQPSVPVDARAECDRLMAAQYDNDLPPQAPYVERAEDLSDDDIHAAISACADAARQTNSRRLLTQKARALAARAQRWSIPAEESNARNDMNQAIVLWERAAEAGSGSALNFLGSYYKGTFNTNMTYVTPNFGKALDLWSRGAELGHVRAMRNAGAMLLWGAELYPPVARNLPRAKDLLTRAARRGEIGAASELGQAYLRGDPTEKNVSAGVELITMACRGNDDAAKAFFDRELAKTRRLESLPPRPPGCEQTASGGSFD